MKQCIETDKKYKLAYNHIGIAYDLSGKHEKALDYYCKILSNDKYNQDVLNNAALALWNLGLLDEARDYFVRSLKIDKNQDTIENLKQLLRQINKAGIFTPVQSKPDRKY